MTFNTTKSFVAAISGRYVNIPHADANKRVIFLIKYIKNYYNF